MRRTLATPHSLRSQGQRADRRRGGPGHSRSASATRTGAKPFFSGASAREAGRREKRLMRSPGNETIAAIATPLGAGGIGIVRISGPDALAVGARVFRSRGGRSLEAAPPLTLLLGDVVAPRSGEQIDEAFALHMREGRSYTGEPTVEIQCHGGRAVLDAVLRAVFDAGARPAEPGEFTRRAFFSGRLDLSQAEAVADLVGASTESARRSALSRLRGALGDQVRRLRERVVDQVAAAEALLDHGDDELNAAEPDGAMIASLASEVRALIALGESHDARCRAPRVVIAGRANSGKSSIFNMLSRNERSIVSPTPGTTRDYIEEHSAIEGTLVTLVDTAGLRESLDPLEAEGVRRSRRQMLEADLLLLTIDHSSPLDAGDLLLLEEFQSRFPLVVLSKSDLPGQIDRQALRESYPELRLVPLSVMDGEGCRELGQVLVERCRSFDSEDEGVAPNLRQRIALGRAGAALEDAAGLLNRLGAPLDQAVTDLRRALAALDEITGEAADDEIIDRVFSRFCIGK